MKAHTYRMFSVRLGILLMALSGARCDLLSSDPCNVMIGEKPMEFLDETVDYRASNCQQLSEEIGIAWSTEGNTIKFEVHAATEGWVALGISPGPGMRGADIALGWVNHEGVGFLFDGKNDIKVKEIPKKDLSQDVQLLKYSEKNGRTSLLFSRPIISEDQAGDHDIKGRVWIVWAFASEDPDEDDWEDLAFHKREGATSVRFPAPASDDHVEL